MLFGSAISAIAGPHRVSPPWVKHEIAQWLEPGNLWVSIAQNFQLKHAVDHLEVQSQIKWYETNSYYLIKMAEKSQPYLHFISQEVQKRGLPSELALIPFIESEFDPYAFSRAGASGLWQIMPSTGKGFGLKQTWWYDGRRDVFASTQVALDYLKYLGEYFHGDWYLALAAYDSGEGTVQSAIAKAVKQNKRTDFWSLKLSHETKNYVPRLLALATIIHDPKKYGVTLPIIKNEPYLVPVDIGSQIALSHAATLAGIDVEEIYHLNPGFNHWATSPKGPHRLLLPIEIADKFKAALKKLPENNRIHYEYHTVKSGETLTQIARSYHIPTIDLQHINQLPSQRIKSGMKLKIPPTNRKLAKALKHYNKKYQRHTQKARIKKLPAIHTVKKGETLSSIASHYHLNAKTLAQHNHLTDVNKIRTGQKISLR